MLYLIPLLTFFAFHSQSAFACSCAKISSMEDAVEASSHVVVVRVASEDNWNKSSSVAEVEALRVLKGSITGGDIEIEDGSFCYQSLGATDLEPGAVYVLPLMVVRGGVYRQPGCSHSAAQVVGEELYVFELSEKGAGRERKLLGNFNEILRKWGM